MVYGADRSAAQRSDPRCLSISNIDQRIECLEGRLPIDESVAGPLPSVRNVPSFNCAKANTSIEYAICSDTILSEWDSRLGEVYRTALNSSTNGQAIAENQRRWLQSRNQTCGLLPQGPIHQCLLEMTVSRVSQLGALASGGAEAARPKQNSQPASLSSETNTVASGPARAQQTLALAATTASPMESIKPPTRVIALKQEDGSSFPLILLLAPIALGLWLAIKYQLYAARKKKLIEKYGETIALRILAQKAWLGMTDEQLLDSWGHPADKDREIWKTKIKETWKYNSIGKNRFNDRVYLQDGTVVGIKGLNASD